jgi:diguanylate cyclase
MIALLVTGLISSLAMVNFSYACLALTIGFVSGVWVFGKPIVKSRLRSLPNRHGNRAPKEANQRVSIASTRLKDLASNVASEDNSHALVAGELSGILGSAESDSTIDVAVFQAIGKMVTSNTELQKRLEVAEQQVESQAAALLNQKTAARTDALTGLANRRGFDDELVRQFDRWKQTGRLISLLIMDIDHFKKFNDTHGHQAGDEVLRHVGSQLTAATRETDIACRYGGEEFAVVMPDTIATEAIQVAERIRETIENSLTCFDGNTLKVTTSVGLTQATRQHDAKQMLKQADNALYQSKKTGRNCGHLHDGSQCIPITPGTTGWKSYTQPVTLTGPVIEPFARLPGRNFFEDELRRHVSESQLCGVPLSVMHVKIEGYEAIWKQLGPTIAHHALKSVSRSINNTLCKMDILAQTDQGEFIIMLPGSSQAEATQVGHRMKAAVSGSLIPTGTQQLELKIHQGIAEADTYDTATDLMQRAQSAINRHANWPDALHV